MSQVLYRIKGRFVSPETFRLHQDKNEEVEVKTVAAAKATKESVLKLTLPNGLELSGPHSQVLETAKTLGYKEADLFPEKDWYMSSTHGPIRIADMQTNHLMNATAKKMQPYLRDLVKSSKVGRDFIQGLNDWRGIDAHLNLLAMVHELSKRYDR